MTSLCQSRTLATWCRQYWVLNHSSLAALSCKRHLETGHGPVVLMQKTVFQQRQHSSSLNNPVVQKLKGRGLIRVAGKDAVPFLQGLVTNDVEALFERRGAMYTMMLNVQGRVVYDMLMYTLPDCSADNPGFLLECESGQISDLKNTMTKYRIRRKVDIAEVSDTYDVWSAFPSVLPPTKDNVFTLSLATSGGGAFICVLDPRLPCLGNRLILPSDVKATSVVCGSHEASSNQYTERRFQLGVGEGTSDIPPGNALPLECNAVFLNGVSFNKGCYIGQELTARSHHTGVIRKRLMPVKFISDHSAEAGDTVENETGKNCGKFRSSCGNLGLALLRVTESLASSSPLQVVSGEKKKLVGQVKTSVPFWWPQDSDQIVKQALDQQSNHQTEDCQKLSS